MPLPYWRLSGFYFFYFAFVGGFSPYWSLYLQSLQFSAFQIGVLMSLLSVMRVFAPNVWGWLADKSGKRVSIVRVAAAASLVSYLGVFAGTGFLWLLVVMSLLSFFWAASLPLVEATTFSHLKEASPSYGRIRLWGSVGFIVAVVGVGYILDFVKIDALLSIIVALLLGIVIFAWLIPEAQVQPHATQHEPAMNILLRADVLALIAACFLMATAHGPYYTFYSIYLVEHGYSKSMVGWLWALGVMCEIAVFFWLPHLLRSCSLRAILLFSFAMAVIRFLLIGWAVDVVLIMVVAQMLHAATFGSFHAAAIAAVNQFFQGRHQATGQAIYTSLSFGAGGMVGALFSGYTWDSLGPALTFSISAVCAFVALGLIFWKLKLPAQAGQTP